MSVQSSLVMHPINTYGTEALKDKFLPKLGPSVSAVEEMHRVPLATACSHSTFLQQRVTSLVPLA